MADAAWAVTSGLELLAASLLVSWLDLVTMIAVSRS